MKNICLLFIGLLGGMLASAQVVEFTDGEPMDHSMTICFFDSVSVAAVPYFPNLPGAGGTGQIDIDWGDGTGISEAITFTGATGGGAFYPNLFNHGYTVGSYVAKFYYLDELGNDDTITWNLTVTDYCGVIVVGVLLDQDGNGTGDVYINNAKLDLADASSNVTTYTLMDSMNINTINMSAGPYTASVNTAWMAANNYIDAQPASQTVDFGPSPHVELPGFVVKCDPNTPLSQADISVGYFTGWGFRAGLSTGYITLNVCNRSCSGPQPANLSITFDPLLTVATHNIPGATVSGNTISADITASGCQTYEVYFSVPGPTPAGTPLAFSANVNPTSATDYDPSNNSATANSEVRNSWDPNDKSVNRPAVVSPSLLDEFTYVIRFQNMGNDDALNIVVKDTLDSDLDLSTFSLLELSHDGSVNVDPATRIATFNFPNINLPASSQNEPGSHGYAIYKIKENAGLPVGAEITNTAYIYFDFNPPIITNTTSNVNQFSGVQEAAADAFSVYPVPAGDYLTVVSKNNTALGDMELLDATGKTVFAGNTAETTYTVDTKTLAGGVYLLRVRNAEGVLQQKVLVGK